MIYQTYGGEVLKRSAVLDDYLNKVGMHHFENHNNDAFMKKIYGVNVTTQRTTLKQSGLVYVSTGMCQPFLYYDNGVLDCAGVIEYDCDCKTGTFFWRTLEWRLEILNVHSYYVYAKVYGGDKYLVLDSTHIPELSELNDIYVAASIKIADGYMLKVFHNDELVFEEDNIYPELYVPFQDLGTYKTRPTYVRYSIKQKEGLYSNFMYSIDHLSEYQLDDSVEKPSSFIDYGLSQKEWNRFKKEIYGENYAISIFLHLTNSKTSQIIGDFIKTADKTEVVQNVFEDDTSVNLKVTYINRPGDVRFLYYCAYKEPELLGSTIMGIPMGELKKGTLNYEFEHRYVTGSNGIDVYYYKRIVRELFEKCNEPMKINCLPKQIYDKCIDSHDMAVYIYQYLRDNFAGKYEANYINIARNVKPKIDFPAEIEKYDEIFQNIVAREGYKGRWKNELSLYQVVKKEYPDAIYQYHCEWLGRQSLDIFVPSINTGFEYQGLQHYQAVEFFGGEEALKRRILLDNEKKKLCYENGVKIVEWKYDEPISKLMLKKKIQIDIN